METLPSVLDLDEIVTLPVKIGSREFQLTQQSWPVLKRIVHYINTDGESEVVKGKEKEKPDAEAEYTDVMSRNYERSVPIIALMFGYDKPGGDRQEVIDFLTLHLTPAKALKVFQAWWQLNEVDDFFDRGGKTLLHPEIAQAIKAEKNKLLAGESVS